MTTPTDAPWWVCPECGTSVPDLRCQKYFPDTGAPEECPTCDTRMARHAPHPWVAHYESLIRHAHRVGSEVAAQRDALQAEVEKWRQWQDEPSPEDGEIEAAFPTRSGSHAAYARAMELVRTRHSKGSLVALVNWLLVDLAEARESIRHFEADLPKYGRRMEELHAQLAEAREALKLISQLRGPATETARSLARAVLAKEPR